jgi:PKD repeat protein
MVNRPPLADSGGPYLGWIDEPIQFDGSASRDIDGTISSYSWSFGDQITQNGQKPTHTYTQIGIYTITLTVTDNLGGTNTVTTIARVVKNPPHANANGPFFAYPNQTVYFDGSQSNDSDGVLIQWLWDFGDGTNGTGETSTHIYQEKGAYHIILTVVDNEGETDTDTTTATITGNLPPSLPKINGSKNGEPQIEYTYRVVSEDPEQDSLSYLCDWGDGTSFISPIFSSGTILIAIHQWTTPGNYTIHVCAIDAHNCSSTSLSFIVKITNKPMDRPYQNSLPDMLLKVLGFFSFDFVQMHYALIDGMVTIMVIGVFISLLLKRIRRF